MQYKYKPISAYALKWSICKIRTLPSILVCCMYIEEKKDELPLLVFGFLASFNIKSIT